MLRRLLLALILSFQIVVSPAFAEHRLKSPRQAVTSPYQGRTIDSITIEVGEIFEHPEELFLYEWANELKIPTKQEVIRRELLFAEGEPYDQFLIEESERYLRIQRYLRDVTITPQEKDGKLNVVVKTNDTWTIIPQVGFSSGVGRNKTSVGIIESNVLGYGKRAELFYEEDESRESIEGLYDDPRLFGSDKRLILGAFHRTDGERVFMFLGHPFRSLVEDSAWETEFDVSDTIGRLFQNGDERFIFRQKKADVALRYTLARGDPEFRLRRLSFGYAYEGALFSEAEPSDYEDLDIDPASVSQDPDLLAKDRRFSGPSLVYEVIEPDFISANYIDRFERVEDYNLGVEYSVNSQIAPTFLGSRQNAYLTSINRGNGYRLGGISFLRGEVGIASRIEADGAENSLIRGELRYYNVLGPLSIGDLFIGKHTLASSLFLDFGDDLDKDRELLVGGDNVVRGYEARTFTGDKRIGVNFEDRMHFVDDAFQLVSLGGALFVDAGGATTDPLGDLIMNNMYSDIGFGLRLAFPRSSGSQVLRVDVAFPLRDGPDGSGEFEPRIIISGGQLFGSRLRTETLGPAKANETVGVSD